MRLLDELALDYLVAVNPGCQRQLATELRRRRSKTKVIHLAELVARHAEGA
jgi:glycolate oxidase iron-sulfur subunit